MFLKSRNPPLTLKDGSRASAESDCWSDYLSAPYSANSNATVLYSINFF